MEYFTTNIDDVEIAVMNTPLPVKAKAESNGFFEQTSSPSKTLVPKKVENVLESIKPVLSCIVLQGKDILSTEVSPPDELTMTLGLGYSIEAGMWVLGGKSEMTFEVEMTWKRNESKSNA